MTHHSDNKNDDRGDDGAQNLKENQKKRNKRRKRVSFPPDEQIVSGFAEHRNSAIKDDSCNTLTEVMVAYQQSCSKHQVQPRPHIMQQLQGGEDGNTHSPARSSRSSSPSPGPGREKSPGVPRPAPDKHQSSHHRMTGFDPAWLSEGNTPPGCTRLILVTLPKGGCHVPGNQRAGPCHPGLNKEDKRFLWSSTWRDVEEGMMQQTAVLAKISIMGDIWMASLPISRDVSARLESWLHLGYSNKTQLAILSDLSSKYEEFVVLYPTMSLLASIALTVPVSSINC
ncbi:unnamed protein product [Pleuronectes platessa]|uniref:Uncharacterized protein n=1 Tax=Pleuronectes platessa TaxID=8262 RepID=A0A9N7TST9_PLEPL|nr:unnamed protein product [Pleuronectes platessa]